jgi:PAS domain S-box-containing protein
VELEHIKKDGTGLWCELNVRFLRDAENQAIGVLGITRSAHQRRQTEQKLQESEERFRNLAEAIDDVVWTVSVEDGRMLYVNPAAEKVYGRCCREFYENSELWLESVHPEDRQRVAQSAERLLERGWKDDEYRIVRPDGEVRWLHDRARVILDRGGNPLQIGGLATDITDRKRAEQDLLEEHRRLRSLLDGHEQDRKLVAYEIHDAVAQPLAAALMQLEAAVRQFKTQNPAVATEGCDSALQLLRESINKSRQLMGGLRPVVLDEFGVVSAVNNLITDSCSEDGPEIEYAHQVQFDRLASPLETTIFRIVQECLANALKHSRSEKIRIALVQQEACLRIEIQDWGVGFELETVGQNRFGLEGIRERARLFGGQAMIDSRSGVGTHVTVTLPLWETICEQTEEATTAG